jgi:hypothetical protein
MKAKRWFLALLAILAGTLVFGGCVFSLDDENEDCHDKKTGNNNSQVYYTVNFIVLGGPNVPPTQTVKYGERVTEPVVKDSNNNIYEVIWYTDQQFTKTYNFSTPVIEDKTLYGKWKLDNQSNTGNPYCK